MNSSSGPYTASDVSMFIKAANEEVVKARKVINQAKKISNHIKKMESLVNAKRKSILKINHPAQLPQNIRAGMQKLQKLRAGLSLFMPMEEIVARMIDEAKTVNETQPADTLFKQIQKDILVSKLEMKGHLHGLEVFINSINSLTAYLSAEDEILNKLEDRTSGENDFSTLTGIYLEAGDANKASKIIDQWMERFPDSVEAVNHKALSSAMLLDFEGAINCWEDVIQKDPGMKGRVDSQRRAMAEYWIERAEQDVVIQNKCIQRALMLWSETAFVLELKESLWPDVWQLVMLNIDNDLIQKAEQVLTAWEPVQSVIPEWYFAMARIRYKQDKFGKAVGMIRSALELKPDIPQWIAFEARVLMETDQFDQGIERLEKAVKLDPLQAVLWEEVGDAFFEHKDFNSAAVAYERCVDALPDMSDVIRKFGDACYNLNQLDTARNAYLLVLEKDPQNRQASDRLAGIEAQIQMK